MSKLFTDAIIRNVFYHNIDICLALKADKVFPSSNKIHLQRFEEFVRSLIEVKQMRGPTIEPRETPAIDYNRVTRSSLLDCKVNISVHGGLD